MTREPVSEHDSSGPLDSRVGATLAAAGGDRPGVSFEASQRLGAAQIVATRADG
jgi:hypothetical protein